MAHTYIDPFSGKIKSLNHANMVNHRARLKRLYANIGDWYPRPVAWSEYAPFDWTNPGAPRPHADDAFLKRIYRSPYAKYARMRSNRKVRHAADVPPHCGYRRVYDFWWEID